MAFTVFSFREMIWPSSFPLAYRSDNAREHAKWRELKSIEEKILVYPWNRNNRLSIGRVGIVELDPQYCTLSFRLSLWFVPLGSHSSSIDYHPTIHLVRSNMCDDFLNEEWDTDCCINSEIPLEHPLKLISKYCRSFVIPKLGASQHSASQWVQSLISSSISISVSSLSPWWLGSS